MSENPIKQAEPAKVLQKSANAQQEAAKKVAEQQPTPNFSRNVDPRGPGKPINDKRYICHTAPSTFVFSDGTRFQSPDGILYASTVMQQAELEAAVCCGNIAEYDGKPFQTDEQTPAR